MKDIEGVMKAKKDTTFVHDEEKISVLIGYMGTSY